MWADKYPILVTYQQEVNVSNYVDKLQAMLNSLQAEYGYNDENAFWYSKIFYSKFGIAKIRKINRAPTARAPCPGGLG